MYTCYTATHMTSRQLRRFSHGSCGMTKLTLVQILMGPDLDYKVATRVQRAFACSSTRGNIQISLVSGGIALYA